MTRNGKVYIATIAENCRETAARYGLGLECDTFCTAANLEDRERVREAAELLAGVSRRVLHAPFNELCPAAIDPAVRAITRSRYEQAWRMAQRFGVSRMVVPGPSWGARAMEPWWRFTISLAMERPRPVPPDSRERALSTR